jgi:hypothetical protein
MSETASVTPDMSAAADVAPEVSAPETPDVSDDLGSDEPADGESFEEFKARQEKKASKKTSKKEEPEPDSDSDTDTDSEPEPKADKEAKEPDFKPVKLKAGDQEVEVKSLEELTRIAQKGFGAEKKFQEAAKLRQQAEGLIETIKDNPIELMRHPALREKFEAAAEELIWEKIQKEQMTQEERELADSKAELERYRRQEQERQKAEQVRQRQELEAKYRADYQKQFVDALETGGIPKSDWSVQRMALYMKQALAQGYKNITPADVVPLVKKDWQKAQADLYGALDGDKLIETLGADVVEKIRKADVSKFKQRPQATGKVGGAEQSQAPRRRYTSPDQLLDL